MDPRSSIDKQPHHESIFDLSSRWSVSSKNNSVREVSFADLGSKHIRHGSAGADSEMLSMSQKEIKDEDARLIYINDPERTNERLNQLPQLAVFVRGASIMPLAFVLLVLTRISGDIDQI